MTVINTNTAALTAQANMKKVANDLDTAMERLSSGMRINSSADDAAGLSIMTRMESQVRGLNMAMRNAADGISLTQSAEGGIEEVTNILQRMRELSIQASNGTFNDSDRVSLQAEVSQLSDELDRIAETTTFNGQNILDGSYSGNLNVTGTSEGNLSVNIGSVASTSLGARADGPATAAAAAQLEVTGMSVDASDYQGKTFSVDVNGATATVSLPNADAGSATSATVGGAAVGEDRGSAASQVVSNVLFTQELVDMSAVADRRFEMRVNDSDFHMIDVTDALMSELGLTDVHKLNNPGSFGDSTSDMVTATQFVNAVQNAIDDSGYFTGDNAVTVSLDNNGFLHMEAGGANEIQLTESTDAGVAGTFLTSFVNATAADYANSIDLSTNANAALKATVNGGVATTIEFFDLLDDASYVKDRARVTASELVNVLQTKLDEVFTGDNKVNVSVDSEGYLNFKVEGGVREIVFAEAGALSDGVTAAGTFVATAIKAAGSATIKNEDTTVNFAALGIESVVDDFDDVDMVMSVTVNANEKVDIDMTSYIRSAAADVSAVNHEEMVNALQAAFDANFTGDDAITVIGTGDGKLAFEVASATGYLKIEDYDPLVGTAGTFASSVLGADLELNQAHRLNSSADWISNTAKFSDHRGDKQIFRDQFSREVKLDSAKELFSDGTNEVVSFLVTGNSKHTAGDTITLSNTGVATTMTYTVTTADAEDSTGLTLVQNLATAINATATLKDQVFATAIATSATTSTLSLSNVIANNAATADYTITLTSDNAGGAGATISAAVQTFDGSTTDLTIGAGTDSFTLELDNDGTAVTLTMDQGDFGSLEALAAEFNRTIQKSGQFSGDRAVTVKVVDGYTFNNNETPGDQKRYLIMENAAGKSIELGGTEAKKFFGSQFNSTIGNTRILDSLGTASYGYDTSGRIDGGVDTTAGLGVVEVSIEDGNTSITRQVSLGNQSEARSFSDFASDLQTAVNAAFADDGYSVSASYADGALSISLDQTGGKTLSLSGAIIQDAFGSDISASGRDAGAVLADMDAVTSAINEDFDAAGLGARASFNADTNTLVFEATTGPVGSASTLALAGSDLSELQFGDNTSATGDAGNATHVTIAEINIGSVDGAENAIASIDNAIAFINSQRAELGAIENRLDHTINNLSNVVVNTEASKSRIADADFAVETGALTKAQVLSQAATAMLAQANASKQSVLSLLQ